MKVDRILEIIVYLVNHDNVPASYLAERFHVSVRTIQRDMVSISSIGIPIYLNPWNSNFVDANSISNYAISKCIIHSLKIHLFGVLKIVFSHLYSIFWYNKNNEKPECKEHTPMKNIKIEFTNERILPASGLAVVGDILGKSDFVKRCNRMDIMKNLMFSWSDCGLALKISQFHGFRYYLYYQKYLLLTSHIGLYIYHSHPALPKLYNGMAHSLISKTHQNLDLLNEQAFQRIAQRLHYDENRTYALFHKIESKHVLFDYTMLAQQ